MKPLKIATLITCHNRREKTIACLDTLFNQELDEKCQLFVYLVDDGCSDGTGEAVRKQFPDVKVLEGDGNLYWCGGMRVAWAEAMKGDYDYYLWLNDDTILFPGAVDTLLVTARDVHEQEGRDGIIVGSCCDPESGKHTYGGRVKHNQRCCIPDKFLPPSDQMQPCDTMNGNCVLVPRAVVQSVGNMSQEFTQWIGDTDYGLRAKTKGFSLWIVPGYVGTCNSNENGCRWADPSLSLRERLKLLYSPKGLPPNEWMVFVKRHVGFMWPWYWLKIYVRVFFPKIWVWRGKEFEPPKK